ncbi:MAG: hypothetical protein GTO02_14920, partial [Candidatus Dadabacteria bacterium]|nr:hypothetical protein [Candidatus Dadabacteria bacterium]
FLKPSPHELEGEEEGNLIPDTNFMNKWRNWRTGPKYVREDLDAELFGALDDCLFLVGNSDQNKYLRKMIKDLNLSSSVILTGIIPHN